VAIDDLSSERALQQLGMEQLGEASPVLRRAPGNLIKALAALLTGDITQAADLFAAAKTTLNRSVPNISLNASYRTCGGCEISWTIFPRTRKSICKRTGFRS